MTQLCRFINTQLWNCKHNKSTTV